MNLLPEITLLNFHDPLVSLKMHWRKNREMLYGDCRAIPGLEDPGLKTYEAHSQSGVQEVLKGLNKRTKVTQIREVIQLLSISSIIRRCDVLFEETKILSMKSFQWPDRSKKKKKKKKLH